jgi:PPP family 3-phenylpropionic acid transporter
MHARRASISAFASYFLIFVTFAILSPYLQLYLKARGFTESRIGLLLGLLELAGVAGPMVLARTADARPDSRWLLAGCLLVPVLSFLPLEATTLLPVAAASVAVMGFAYRSVITLLDSAASRLLPDPARQYGRLRVAGSLGFLCISVVLQLSGAVTGDSPHPIVIAFAAASLAAGAAVFLLPRAPADGYPHPQLAEKPGGLGLAFWCVIGVVFLGRFSLGAYYSFFSLYLKQTFPGTGVSLLWAIGPLAEIPTIWFSGPLIRRFGIRALLIVSLAAISLRLSLFVVAPSLAVVALAQLLHAFTFGTFHTTAIAFVISRTGQSNRTMGMSIYNAVGLGVANFLASTAGGFIAERSGYQALFLSYAIVPLAGIAALLFFGRKWIPAPSARERGASG